jgi:beta-lactamase regulating signal transducer with metallopeptidase domain
MISTASTQYLWLWALAWQSTICLAAGLAGSYFCRRRAARAHRVLLLGLMAAALIPVMSWIVRQNQWGLFVAERAVPQSEQYSLPPREDIVIPAARTTSETKILSTPQSLEAMPVPETARFRWTQAIMPLWFAASSVLLLRLATRFLLAWRLVKRSEPIEGIAFRDTIEAAKNRLGIRTVVAVRAGGNARSPVIWCWGRRPILLIPAGSHQDSADLDWMSIVWHELAHWRRRDHVSGLFAEMLICALPWQPLLWWARRRLMDLSEEACDDWVIAAGQTTTSYARTLLGLTPQGRAAILPAVVTTRTGLAARVRRILEEKCGSPRAGLRWSLAAGILTAGLALGVAFAQTRLVEPDIRIQYTDSEATGIISGVQQETAAREGHVRLRLTDPNGEPVAGAKAGPFADVREEMLGGMLQWSHAWTSNENGYIALDVRDVYRYRVRPGPGAVYILHEDRKLGALQALAETDEGGVFNVPLSPVCRVHGTISSPALEAMGRPLWETAVYVRWRGSHILQYSSAKHGFEFLLPPGEYTLAFHGGGARKDADVSVVRASARDKMLSLEIRDNQRDLDLGVIELQAARLAMLTGRPAPELGPIKAWANGSPVTLAQLRGRVVVLHFGREYPSSYRDVSELVELHNTLADKGLTVIAIHNCGSMEELEERWPRSAPGPGGIHAVPFRIAIDGGEPTYPEGADRPRAGATYGRYDIPPWGATVLIDQAGKVVGYLAGDAKHVIREMLGVQEQAVPPPPWTARFNEVYRLENGQTLKQITPPFIPERRHYYIDEEIPPASGIPDPPDYFGLRWDAAHQRTRSIFGTSPRLGSLLEHVIGLRYDEYDGPVELLDLELPGDWIVCDNAPQETRLRAFEQLLGEGLGRHIRFERRVAARQTIVATGRFRFHPVYERERVCVFSGDSWATDNPGELFFLDHADSTQEFVRKLGALVRMPILDQTDKAPETTIPFCADLDAALRDVENSDFKMQRLKSLLANVSAQTALQFEIRPESCEVWHVTEKDDSR